MRKQLTKIALVATCGLALTFTFGCEEKSSGKSSSSAEEVAPAEEVPASAPKETFTDSRDSKVYKWVKIGNQVWMAENLSYNAEGSKCYDDDESNCQKYGRLYDWSNAKSACPEGWHLPSDAEWKTLVDSAGGDEIAGEKLKATSGWNSSKKEENSNGTDEFGFSALPGGVCGVGGNFGHAGGGGFWWSATEDKASDAWIWNMRRGKVAYRNSIDKTILYSVRCVQN